MFEKVNPSHPDKVADRIAGAIVDLAYSREHDPKIAVEVLLGHGYCTVIIESSVYFKQSEILPIVFRIAGQSMFVNVIYEPQDAALAQNQAGKIRCGDNGIFKGTVLTAEEYDLTQIAKDLYKKYPYDGKYLIDGDRLIICQSHIDQEEISYLDYYYSDWDVNINPLGPWSGGPDVDAGATNRKLGSDMGGSVTGGGLHGKDLSKADVTLNIYAWLKAQQTGKTVELSCAIGDDYIDGQPYGDIVELVRKYINNIGGFEKFAEWGLIR